MDGLSGEGDTSSLMLSLCAKGCPANPSYVVKYTMDPKGFTWESNSNEREYIRSCAVLSPANQETGRQSNGRKQR